MRGIIALAIGASLVAGCAGGNRPPSRVIKQIDRALAQAPGQAQPSIIVKAELALSRDMREDNAKQALTKFAAPGAKIHTKEGLVDALTFIASSASRGEGPRLEPKTVLMSCDGSQAVSLGRFTEADGTVGNYVAVWERQRDIRPNNDDETGYRYAYFSTEPDNPQPPPRVLPQGDPGGIVVEAIDSVRADIASCRDRDKVYLKSLAEPAAGNSSGSGNSLDRTLQWNWFANPQGKRTIEVSLWRKGARETVLTQNLPSKPN